MNGKATTLVWDHGTAYDLFLSLFAVFLPERFGLPGAWAAGVRARLPEGLREHLLILLPISRPPLLWIHRLRDPKDATTAIYALERCEDEELLKLFLPDQLVLNIDDPRTFPAEMQNHPELVEAAKPLLFPEGAAPYSEAAALLRKGVTAFYDIFFREEERRIRFRGEQRISELTAAVTGPSSKATSGAAPGASPGTSEEEPAESPSNYLQLATAGALAAPPEGTEELIIAPAFWTGSLVLTAGPVEGSFIAVVPARKRGESLVPGASVPELLQGRIKALSDPTRLKVLNLLAHEALTQAELARRLRLRPPTLVHHLKLLTSAGIVTQQESSGGNQTYRLIRAATRETFMLLEDFLSSNPEEPNR